MENFKNLKELYQALLDGREIINKKGTIAVMINDNEIKVTPLDFKEWTVRLCLFDAKGFDNWTIYQEPEKWFRVIAHNKEEKRPTVYLYLYKSEEDFLEFHGSKKEDFHWIKLEEVIL